MKSVWRKHLIICLVLGLLAIPVYFLDQALLGGRGSGSNWITLDFRGLIFWTYVLLAGIGVTMSSIAILVFPKSGVLRIYFASIVLSAFLLVTSAVAYGKLQRLAAANQYRAFMDNRKPLINAIELKRWWYVPDTSHPTEVRVNVVVHQSGRFAGNITGVQTDSSGNFTRVFEATNGPESQRQVTSEEAFTYAFPLKILTAGRADNVEITLYLFKALSGPAAGDITKIFMNSPQGNDDGQYFYGVLPAPSQPVE
jgi:hypothetical protein